jgi:hypothetical protein
MALGSEIPENGLIDEIDDAVGKSKSGTKADCVGMGSSFGGTSRCDDEDDGDESTCCCGEAERSSKYSGVVWYVAPVLELVVRRTEAGVGVIGPPSVSGAGGGISSSCRSSVA